MILIYRTFLFTEVTVLERVKLEDQSFQGGEYLTTQILVEPLIAALFNNPVHLNDLFN